MLTDDHKRAAYHARRSSPSSAASGYRSAYAYRDVNTDWSRSYYQHDPDSRVSRVGWFEHFARNARRGMRTVDAVFHGGMVLIVLGGALLFDYLGSSAWSARNQGKGFKDIPSVSRVSATPSKRSAAAFDSADDQAGGGGGSSSPGSSSSASREPALPPLLRSNTSAAARGSWAATMRGQPVTQTSQEEVSAAMAAAAAAPTAVSQRPVAAKHADVDSGHAQRSKSSSGKSSSGARHQQANIIAPASRPGQMGGHGGRGPASASAGADQKEQPGQGASSVELKPDSG